MRSRTVGLLAALFALALPGMAFAQTQSPTDYLAGIEPGCDEIDPWACMLPWPNNRFTVADPDKSTGRRLNLPLGGMPENIAGKPIDAREWNKDDGFSTGSPIITRVPGLDTRLAFRHSGIVPQHDMARAFDPGQPVVVIDAQTLERQLIWAEIDMHEPDPADRALIIRPGTNLEAGRRYIVAIRNVRDNDDNPIPPSPGFRVYRDKLPTAVPRVEQRRPQMERIFETLGRAGIARKDLFIAWDFTTASKTNRTGRLLTMRNRAFAALGDHDMGNSVVEGRAPEFNVTSTQDITDPNDPMGRRIEGTVTVPCFMSLPGCPPALNRIRYQDGKPYAADNTTQANFICNVPKRALGVAGTPVKPSLYGHGLLGGAGEVTAGNVKAMGQEHGYMFCATDWIGMATADVPTVATILADVSNFPHLADRTQQGMVNFMYLGRLMIHAGGFASHPAFQDGGRSFIDTSHLYYDGNSQGGIMGQALVAVSPDVVRGVLGVPGINYSTLLQRSSDFESHPDRPCPAPADQVAEDLQDPSPDDPEYYLELFNISYACPLYVAYPQTNERQLIFALIQQLWDRGEGNGYAAFTRGGLPNTPPKEVLLHAALGDHQVAQIAAETQARTIGAAVRANPFDAGRSLHVTPVFGAERITSWPYRGSAIEIWDSGPVRNPADCSSGTGTGVAPLENVPPTCGRDPHGEPRATVLARRQKAAFLQPPDQSVVIDPCLGGPSHSRNCLWSF